MYMLAETQQPNYAVVELVDDYVIQQYGINYPKDKVLAGRLSGIINHEGYTFICVVNEDGSMDMFNSNDYSIVFVEVAGKDFRFEHESDLKGTSVRYMYADCRVEDQRAVIAECERVVATFSNMVLKKLLPGFLNPFDFKKVPDYWESRIESAPGNKNLTNVKKVSKVGGNGGARNSVGTRKTSNVYAPPEKKVTVFKRKGRPLATATLKAMQEKVNAVAKSQEDQDIEEEAILALAAMQTVNGMEH